MCYQKLIPKVDKFLFRFWYKFFGGLVIRYEYQKHFKGERLMNNHQKTGDYHSRHSEKNIVIWEK